VLEALDRAGNEARLETTFEIVGVDWPRGGYIQLSASQEQDQQDRGRGSEANRKRGEAYLQAGVEYCIIGTRAVREPEFISRVCKQFPGHVIVGIDAKDGMVAVEGWAEISGIDAAELAARFEDDGVSAIVYTDISRDGMMQGVNVEATAALAESISIPVVASGGITNMDDIRRLLAVSSSGISGAITGRAIYEGTLDFAAAQQLADS
jgi:phosphoribosylformimino-5-aminoimidazole carboxamide ribotide isomerase